MAEVTITINGRNYGIACDDGQEKRVTELARFVDGKLREIARSGAASNESHLLVLTSIIMADEIADLRAAGEAMMREQRLQSAAAERTMPQVQQRLTEEDEEAIVSAIDMLAARIDIIAGNLQKI